MKERHWTNLVTGLRYGHCVLVLGPEVPANLASAPNPSPAAQDISYAEALTRQLTSELECDNHRVTGNTLAAVAQQYEDAEGFGPNTMRALAAQFYSSAPNSLSDVHRLLDSLPFSLILTTCHDDLLTRALQEASKKPVV